MTAVVRAVAADGHAAGVPDADAKVTAQTVHGDATAADRLRPIDSTPDVVCGGHGRRSGSARSSSP
jgi:hypothetical protein